MTEDKSQGANLLPLKRREAFSLTGTWKQIQELFQALHCPGFCSGLKRAGCVLASLAGPGALPLAGIDTPIFVPCRSWPLPGVIINRVTGHGATGVVQSNGPIS